MTLESCFRRRRARARQSRGFTLVELMVAVTGGLFVSLAVFAIARESGRFYNRESRISDATLGAVLGFERLKSDIARAGFLGTPNVKQDPNLCGDPVGDASWPYMFKRLASIQISPGAPGSGSPANATLNAAGNNIFPDSLVLMGSYTGAEEFPIWNLADNGTGYDVYLQQNTGPLARLGYGVSTNQLALLQGVFRAGAALRILDQSGEVQFGTITGVAVTPPRVTLSKQPALRFRQGGGVCGLKGNVTGAVVSVVNFIQYDVRKLNDAAYAAVYAGPHPYDTDRTDLIRTELDGTGNPIAGTSEIVAEFAVDLKLGITVANALNNGAPTSFLQLAPGNASISNWAGDLVSQVANPSNGPQRVKIVRARLAVRSQEPDRPTNPGPPGMYRVGLGASGDAPYARVRTLQADIALNNQTSVTY